MNNDEGKTTLELIVDRMLRVVAGPDDDAAIRAASVLADLYKGGWL